MARNSRLRERCSKWLPIVVVLLSIGLLIPSLIMTADIFQTSGENHETNKEVCIKADILDSDYLKTKDGQSFLKTDKGKQSYCFKNANDLPNFLISYQKSLKKFRDEETKPSFLTTNPDGIPTNAFSVHVPLISSIPLTETGPGTAPQFDNTSKYPLHLDTENIGVTGEIVDNFVVTSTGIIIKYTGMYHVYSNVLFDPNSGVKCDEFPIKTWRHDVLRISPYDRQRSGTILTSLYICCDECNQQKKTSYAGGVFLLEAGDHLHVEVSAFGLVRFEKAASYMGLFMLGEP